VVLENTEDLDVTTELGMAYNMWDLILEWYRLTVMWYTISSCIYCRWGCRRSSRSNDSEIPAAGFMQWSCQTENTWCYGVSTSW
jgi:hypothetical protein